MVGFSITVIIKLPLLFSTLISEKYSVLKRDLIILFEVWSLYWSPIWTGKSSYKELPCITFSPTKSILFIGLEKPCVEKNNLSYCMLVWQSAK